MFGKLYAGELKKMFSLKTALIMIAIFIFGFAVITIALNSFKDLTVGAIETDGPEVDISIWETFKRNISEEQAKAELNVLKAQLKELEKEKKDKGFTYYMGFLAGTDGIYNCKSQIAVYKYIIDNGLYNQDLYFYDSAVFAIGGLIDESATSFASMMLGVFAFLLSVYALIIGSGAYANEMQNGTLKILLLKPITRNQLTLAKLLAMLTIVVAAVMAVFVFITAFSYIAYDDPLDTMYYVFNASSVFKAPVSFPLFLAWLDLLLGSLAFGIMAFFFGTLMKKRVFGFVFPYAFNFAATIASLIGIGRFWITNTVAWSGFFGMGSGISTGSNFFISMPLAIVYFGGMVALSFVVFNRRDVA